MCTNRHRANKALKRDSCRVAFLVCGEFLVVKVLCGKLVYAAFTP
ncbi:TPA: DUF3265 domain-containing protein [Vibrio vulnificus]|nr:DUF3265 domain-containing protein [Vibrio vulnificus]